MTTNNNPTTPVSFDALAVGRSNTTPFLTVFNTRNPNSGDVNYQIQQRWYNTSAETEYILTGFSIVSETKTAVWQPVSQSQVAATETLTGNSGGPVGVDMNNNINTVGDGTTINIVGNPTSHTMTASISGSVLTTINADSGSATGSGNAITIAGGTGITTSASGSTVTVSTAGDVAILYTEDAGTAVPSSGNLIIHGTNGISTSGSGHTVTVSVTNGPPFTSIVNQVFTSSGTYTPTSGMLFCSIQCIGGGGAGGGAPATLVSPLQTSAGAGGGAGEYAFGIFTAAQIGASKTVTIGAGGTAVSGSTGGNGGTTSVGALITAFGGTGGAALAATAIASFSSGGLGGTGGSGGDYRTPGQPGFWALTFSNVGVALSGQGGNSIFGSSAPMQNNGNAIASLGHGSGGTGAEAASGFGPFIGGNGTSGIVVITEYI